MGRPRRDQPVEWWQEQVKLGIRYREKFGRSLEWSQAKMAWRNRFAEHILPVNLIYSRGAAMLANFYFRDPKVVVTAPNRPDLAFHAKLVETLDNWLIREIMVKPVIRRCGLNSFLCGAAPWIVGYDSEFGVDRSALDAEVFEDASLTQFDEKSGKRIEFDATISPGMPWVADVNPEDWVVPWGLDQWKRAPWYARRVVRLVGDIKDDRKYNEVGDLKPNVGPDAMDRKDSRKAILEKMQEVGDYHEFYEIHDLRTGRVYAVSPSHGKFMRNEVDELQIEGLNAGVVSFNDDPDFFWTTPDALYLKPQQLEINDVTTQWSKHRRAAVAKIIAKRKAFTPADIDRLTSEQVKAVVEMNGDVQRDIKELSATIPDDFRVAREMIMNDSREIVGFSRVQAGEFQGKTHITAREVSAVQQGSEIRMDARRDVGADTLVEMLRKVNQIIFKMWTAKRVMQVVGPDGAAQWVKYTGPELRGEYNLQVDPDSGIPTTKANRRNELMAAIAFVAKTGGNIQPLVRQMLAEFPGVNLREIYPTQTTGVQPALTSSPQRPASVDKFVQAQQRTQDTPQGAFGGGGL